MFVFCYEKHFDKALNKKTFKRPNCRFLVKLLHLLQFFLKNVLMNILLHKFEHVTMGIDKGENKNDINCIGGLISPGCVFV